MMKNDLFTKVWQWALIIVLSPIWLPITLISKAYYWIKGRILEPIWYGILDVGGIIADERYENKEITA